MNDHMDGPEEERFVDFLREAARKHYNPPPETPVEAMWQEIRTARDAADEARDAGAGEAGPSVIRRIRPTPWWIGIAAALAIGIGIGRLALPGGGPDGRPVATAEDGPSKGGTPAGSDERATVPEVVADAGDAPAGGTIRDAPAGGENALSDGPAAGRTLPLVFRRNAADHLVRSEALLTMFQTSGGAATSEIGPWARELLTRTRLLLDSPAGRDLELRPLLEDLELVLAQIVQLQVGDDEEAQIIDESLDERGLLSRLRAASGPGGRISGNVRITGI